ncbi:hypothetical protein EV360DRAFT_68512 [Lentinula raphanica]|nr:hypothetical protein EV360DRAFT_68512 [Lentinula raphanica]
MTNSGGGYISPFADQCFNLVRHIPGNIESLHLFFGSLIPSPVLRITHERRSMKRNTQVEEEEVENKLPEWHTTTFASRYKTCWKPVKKRWDSQFKIGQEHSTIVDSRLYESVCRDRSWIRLDRTRTSSSNRCLTLLQATCGVTGGYTDDQYLGQYALNSPLAIHMESCLVLSRGNFEPFRAQGYDGEQDHSQLHTQPTVDAYGDHLLKPALMIRKGPTSAMYLFPKSTWHSFVARMLLISMIAAAVASPMLSRSSAVSSSSSGVRKPAKSSKKESPNKHIRTFKIEVIDHFGADYPAQDTWTLCVTPSDPLPPQYTGYRTNMQTSGTWLPLTYPEKPGELHNAKSAQRRSPSSYRAIEIGTAKMSTETRKEVLNKLDAKVIDHRSHKLLNSVSIFQVLILLEPTLIEHTTDSRYKVIEYTFDLSDFQKEFDEMVLAKGTAAGFALDRFNMARDWDMYKMIHEKQLTIKDMLDAKNAQVFEWIDPRYHTLDLPNQLPAEPGPEETGI